MEQAAQGGGGMMMLILMIVMFVVLIVMPAKSQKKREQELLGKVNALQKGEQIILSSGIIGTVVGFKDNALEVKVAESVKLTVLKSAVVGFVKDLQVSAGKEGGAK